MQHCTYWPLEAWHQNGISGKLLFDDCTYNLPAEASKDFAVATPLSNITNSNAGAA
jgi:hypothetical protein